MRTTADPLQLEFKALSPRFPRSARATANSPVFTPDAKSWKFESNDFATTLAANGTCAAGLVPVYRAYDNGLAKDIDSNHRITGSHFDYLGAVAAG